MKLEEKVENDVARLLAMIANDGTNPEAFQFVLKKLTRMAILGTKPVGCEPRKYDVPATVPETPAVSGAPVKNKGIIQSDDNHSEDKERWIAP